MFTKNEKRIMNHIKRGCLDVTSLTQITNFKRPTIYAYLSNIYRKLGIGSMAELVYKLHTENINTEVKWYE